jgi:hypothetical protein
MNFNENEDSKNEFRQVNNKKKNFRCRARVENSLGELTRKFIELIKASKNGMMVNLNDAATYL